MAETMRQVWIGRYGPPEVLELREAAMPRPTDDQILIKVAASGVNFADIMARLGLYPDAPKPPCVVGYEVAGEVVAAGPAVTAFSPGAPLPPLPPSPPHSAPPPLPLLLPSPP